MKKVFLFCFLFLFLLFFPSCKPPAGPSEPSEKITVEIRYVRTQVVITGKKTIYTPGLSWILFTPNSQEKWSDRMLQVDENTFLYTLTVWTEQKNQIWVNDPRMYDGKDDFSYVYVARDIYVNDAFASTIRQVGPCLYNGMVIFKIKNSGEIEFFKEFYN